MTGSRKSSFSHPSRLESDRRQSLIREVPRSPFQRKAIRRIEGDLIPRFEDYLAHLEVRYLQRRRFEPQGLLTEDTVQGWELVEKMGSFEDPSKSSLEDYPFVDRVFFEPEIVSSALYFDPTLASEQRGRIPVSPNSLQAFEKIRLNREKRKTRRPLWVRVSNALARDGFRIQLPFSYGIRDRDFVEGHFNGQLRRKESKGRMSESEITAQDECKHPRIEVSFDPEAARDLSVSEIRKRWPRLTCPDCKAVVYASFLHYISGDW